MRFRIIFFIFMFIMIASVSADTPINADTTITESGIYYLTANVTNIVIEVENGNVTLLGNGYAINGNPSGYGLDLNGVSPLDSLIVDSVAFDNAYNNILINSVTQMVWIKNCNFLNSLESSIILLVETSNITIQNNTFRDSPTGFLANHDAVSNISFIDNKYYNISSYGIDLSRTDNVAITNENVSLSLSGELDGRLQLIDSKIEQYILTNSRPKIISSSFAILEFSENITASGNNLSNEVIVQDNLIFVNASNTGLNKPARLTFQNIPSEWQNKFMQSGNQSCPIGFCVNETSLNSSTITFSVQDFSFFYYLIGSDIITPIILNPITSGVIYDTLNSSGAGLGIFLQYLSRAIPLLLIVLAFLIILASIGTSIKEYFIKNI